MGFGDIASLVFVVIILVSFLWPFVGSQVRRSVGSLQRDSTGGPRDFSQSGGFEPIPAATRRVAPVAVFQSHRVDYEEGMSAARSRSDERLTREELAEGRMVEVSNPTEEERMHQRRRAPAAERAQSQTRADHIRMQLQHPESAQMALIIKEVFDNPVGMRSDR